MKHRPLIGWRNADLGLSVAARADHGCLDGDPAAGLCEHDVRTDCASLKLRNDPALPGVHRVPPLKPDRLPNAGQGAIPALLPVGDFGKARLALGFVGRARRQQHADFEFVFLLQVGRIENKIERQPAAFMYSQPPSVNVNVRNVVHGAETKSEFAAVCPS